MHCLCADATRRFVARCYSDDSRRAEESKAHGCQVVVDEHCLSAATTAIDDNVEEPCVKSKVGLLGVWATQESFLEFVYPESKEQELLLIECALSFSMSLCFHEELSHMLRSSHELWERYGDARCLRLLLVQVFQRCEHCLQIIRLCIRVHSVSKIRLVLLHSAPHCPLMRKRCCCTGAEQS